MIKFSLQDYLIRKLSEGPPESTDDPTEDTYRALERSFYEDDRQKSSYETDRQRSSWVSSSSVSPRDSTTSAPYSSSSEDDLISTAAASSFAGGNSGGNSGDDDDENDDDEDEVTKQLSKHQSSARHSSTYQSSAHQSSSHYSSAHQSSAHYSSAHLTPSTHQSRSGLYSDSDYSDPYDLSGRLQAAVYSMMMSLVAYRTFLGNFIYYYTAIFKSAGF